MLFAFVFSLATVLAQRDVVTTAAWLSSQQIQLPASPSIAWDSGAPLASSSDRFVLLVAPPSTKFIQAVIYGGELGSFDVLASVNVTSTFSVRLRSSAAAMSADGALLAIGLCPYLSAREPNGTIVILRRLDESYAVWEEEARVSLPLGDHMTLALLGDHLFAAADSRVGGSYVQAWARATADNRPIWRNTQRLVPGGTVLGMVVDRYSPSGNATLAILWTRMAPMISLHQLTGDRWTVAFQVYSLNSWTMSFAINGGTLAWLEEDMSISYARQSSRGVWALAGSVAAPCILLGCSATLQLSASGSLVVGTPYEVRCNVGVHVSGDDAPYATAVV